MLALGLCLGGSDSARPLLAKRPQDKLYQPEYQEVSTEEQREEISRRLNAASTWLEDEGFGATTVVRGLPDTVGGEESPSRVRGGQKSWGMRPYGRLQGWLQGYLVILSTPFHQMLKEKLAELRKLCQALFFRVEERKKWPERLSALDNLLNHSSMFLK